MTLWQITLSYACAGIITDSDGVVINAAPIFRWMVGKPLQTCEKWVTGKRGSIARVA